MNHHTEGIHLQIGESIYSSVEVSRTHEARAQGLSGRASLCSDCAMLFVFESPGQYGFWMKDMQFAIDILWLREGVIVHKESHVSPESLETLTPRVEADSVLEMLPNEAIQVGQRVELIQHGD